MARGGELIKALCQVYKLFFKVFGGHVSFFGHWCACYGFLVTSPLGFKARVDSALFAFLRRRM